MSLSARLASVTSRDRHELTGRVVNEANAMVLIGKTLADSAGLVAEHSTQQAEHANSLAGSIQQMSRSVADIAMNASQTAAAATEMARLNDDCFEAMDHLVQSVSGVTHAFDRIQAAMARLRETAESVGKVVEVITTIATQTKLLSLNASIEAAHAGEQGRGFAVVAHEVRQLAERTRSSAKEIEDVIAHNAALTEEVCVAIGHGRDTARESVEGAKGAVLALTAVAAEIDKVNSGVQQIAAATEQQSTSAENISANVGDVARLATNICSESRTSHRSGDKLVRIACKIEERLVSSEEFDFFGLAPFDDAVKLNKSFWPLCRFLRQVLGRSLYVRLGHDYADTVHDLGEGRMLLAYLTPSTYVEARERYGIEPLVVPLVNGQPHYRSAIVVRADSPVTTAAQLKDARFAFGDPRSTGSKAMPEAMLREAGLRLRDLGGHGFVGNHDNVAAAVLAGQYDAGGLMLSVAEARAAEGLRVVAISDPIPQFPLCASPRLSRTDRARLCEALIGLRDADILGALGGGTTGFTPIGDRDYDSVRRMLERSAD